MPIKYTFMKIGVKQYSTHHLTLKEEFPWFLQKKEFFTVTFNFLQWTIKTLQLTKRLQNSGLPNISNKDINIISVEFPYLRSS